MSSYYHHTANSSWHKKEVIPEKSRISPTSLQRKTDCTGSNCKVTKSSSSNVTVAVAVAVPIGAILTILSIVLIVVYIRSRKHSLMKNLDPNSEGDLYYLPKMDSSMNSAKSETSATEKRFIYGSYEDFLKPSADNSQSFKDYVRKIHERAPATYNIASLASQNNSKISFFSKRANPSNRVFAKSIENSETLPTVSLICLDTEDDCDQRRSSFDTKRKPRINCNNSQLQLHQTKSDELEPQLSKEEEESMERIRSIYNIYFEKSNSTIQSSASSLQRDSKPIVVSEINSMKMNCQDNLNDTTLAEQTQFEGVDAKESDSSSTPSDRYEDATEYLQLSTPQNAKQIASSGYSEIPFKDKNLSKPTLSLTMPLFNATSTRVASSIYSDVVAKGQLDSSKVPIRVPPLEIPVRPIPKHAQQYPVYHPNGKTQSNNNCYYYNYSPSLLEHPQTFESMRDLPTPTQLAYSTSSRSLTSFKGRPKPSNAVKYIPTVSLNGTALNPMDHPEMFYGTCTEIPSAAYLTKQACMPLPHQLRQSIVMTNPADLSVRAHYKPAGSLSHLMRAQHLPGSSPATTTSSFLSQPSPMIPKVINVRVSGLLDDSDILQPRSMGEILPFNASADDLRKQLGSSHNYEIIP
ncbi:AIS_HP2_G0020890.mRNA.1.CDS.1 [Saccharomyces cerevisiae]|nr:AIS_HP2_G0020890.mRNA.1.CDS.1 [Saccharomyces cerevisiae]CAI6531781.1 AIS_HP2_G0020890.mRNA.1.CDS.1 [Saccharomyces cerevisiae]